MAGELPRQADPGLAGEVHVEQRKGRLDLIDGGAGLGRRGCGGARRAGGAEQTGERSADLRVVIDDEDRRAGEGIRNASSRVACWSISPWSAGRRIGRSADPSDAVSEP
jgi:hypothetical protein